MTPTPKALAEKLTKREIFAMAAMQGMYANPHVYENLTHADIMCRAVGAADSLLEALSTSPTTDDN